MTLTSLLAILQFISSLSCKVLSPHSMSSQSSNIEDSGETGVNQAEGYPAVPMIMPKEWGTLG